MMIFTQKTVFLVINRNTKGYIALLSVIAVSAIGTAIMLAIILSGVNAARNDIVLQQGVAAGVLADSCGEEALQKILETATTSSLGNLTIDGNTCTYEVTSQNGQNITINSTGVVGTVSNRVKIIIATTSPSIVLSSWQEVDSF